MCSFPARSGWGRRVRRSHAPWLPFVAVFVSALLGASCTHAEPVKTAYERGIGPAALSLPVRSFTIDSQSVGDKLVVDVMLPPGYDADPSRRYPVFYMTDGYWRRGEYGVVHALAQQGDAEPCIVVGVGYPDGYDYGVTRERDLVRAPERLLASVATEIIPAIDRDFRTDPARRILWGSSYGGFFALVALSQHDLRGQLFRTYVSVSPMVKPWVDRYPDLLAALKQLSQRVPNLEAELYLAVGGDEDRAFLESFGTFDRLFRSGKFPRLRVQSKIYPGEVHNTVIVPALPDVVKLYLPRTRGQ